MEHAQKKKFAPPAPANRRRTPRAIAERERVAMDFHGRQFVRHECRGRAAKNKGGK